MWSGVSEDAKIYRPQIVSIPYGELIISSAYLDTPTYLGLHYVFQNGKIKYSKYTANTRFLQAGGAFCQLSNGYVVAGRGMLLN